MAIDHFEKKTEFAHRDDHAMSLVGNAIRRVGISIRYLRYRLPVVGNRETPIGSLALGNLFGGWVVFWTLLWGCLVLAPKETDSV